MTAAPGSHSVARRFGRLAGMLGAGLATAALVWWLWQPDPVRVDTAAVARGELLVTVDDIGRTRVRERYTIHAPLDGRLLRTALRAGDRVTAGSTIVAEFASRLPNLLDVRARAEAEAVVRRSEAVLAEAEARKRQAEADAETAAVDLARVRQLHADGVTPTATLEQAERDERRARDGLQAAVFAVQVVRHELEVRRASLVMPEPPVDTPTIDAEPRERQFALSSPIDGCVLRVFEESARSLAAGAPILEVGNLAAIEVVADYLSQDAVRVRPGFDVTIERFGGVGADGQPLRLRGRVATVEPSGFTKVSALGVEEQRVPIVIEPEGPRAAWSALGDGYRVECRIVVDRAADLVLAPAGAVFRLAGGWATFVVDDGRARRRRVELGRTTPSVVEVRAGLQPGDRVVLYPSELLVDGARVAGP